MQRVRWNIELKNETYPCLVTYKNMKTIRLKVRQDYLEVSAPYGIDDQDILKLIYEHEEDLYNRLNKYEAYYDLKDNGYVYLFGKKYKIIVRDLKRKKCMIHGDVIYVYTSYIENALNAFLAQELYDYLIETIQHYLPSYHLNMPQVEIKRYKGRWGSCFYQKNLVSFNTSLVFLDKELIDYVVVHELSHFIEPNHSKNFYLEIEKRMPDYKKRIKLLEEKHV